jgi:ABC-type multidrug transport system permease subunit
VLIQAFLAAAMVAMVLQLQSQVHLLLTLAVVAVVLTAAMQTMLVLAETGAVVQVVEPQ